MSSLKAVGVIPARWGSTRFEGKILADINGKPMIQHVWERSLRSESLDDLIIACDDHRIREAAENFGAKVAMTSKEHPSGTDRIAEAVAELPVDIVINIQGDEPLIRTEVIDQLVNCLSHNGGVQMATVVKEVEDAREWDNAHVVKVALDKNDFAVWFSRSTQRLKKLFPETHIKKHLGIYGYRKEFLMKYQDLPESEDEKQERLEQLRALNAGYDIKTVSTNFETIGVDTPEDLDKLKEMMGGS